MKVLLRPGPYVCGEWDFGGLPARLLGIEKLKIRSANEEYLKEVEARAKGVYRQLAAAGKVEGVTKVEDGMVVLAGSRSMGVALDDTNIQAKLKTKLVTQEGVEKGFDINTDVKQGHVLLSGWVNAEKYKKQAGDVAAVIDLNDKRFAIHSDRVHLWCTGFARRLLIAGRNRLEGRRIIAILEKLQTDLREQGVGQHVVDFVGGQLDALFLRRGVPV